MSFDPTAYGTKAPTFDYSSIKKQASDKAQGPKSPTTNAADGGDPAAGPGLAGGTNVAPDVNSTNITVVVVSALAALGSLDELMPDHLDSGDSLEVELAAVLAKLKKTTDDVDKGKIKTDSEKREAAIKQQKDDLAKAQAKTDEAAESAKHVSLADKFKLAFTWIGAIVAVVVAVVLIATGVGAAVGVALIAAAAIAIAMAVDQTVQMANQAQGKSGGLSMFGMMFQAIGESAGLSGDKLAAFTAKATMGLNIALMIVSVALSFADPEGAESAVTELADIAVDGADAEKAAELGADGAEIGSDAAKGAEVGGEVAEGATQAEGAVTKMEAVGAKVKDIAGKVLKKLEEKLEELIAKLKSGKDALADMKEDGLVKTLEKAKDGIKTLIKDFGNAKIEKVKDFLNDVQTELKAMKEQKTEYVFSKGKQLIEDFAEDFKDNFTNKDEVTGEREYSGYKTAKYVRAKGNEIQDRGDATTSAVSTYNRYEAETTAGESKEYSADAKKDEALAKFISADIDMLIAQMKKHGEAFDAQIDQIMDGVRSHQESLTRHVA